MSILNKIFSGKAEKDERSKLPWIQLHTKDQLQSIKENSTTKPQLIFKHSTRCGISNMVLNQFSSRFNLDTNNIELYFLDLLKHRDISYDIATEFNVEHQSPQLLIIKNGVVVKHASHGAINELQLSQI
ncbi:MAG: bacillithiol system redox-active protein YtxJ [Winogradskyella sp.]|nr:bacillithiol system redox-active protein YtxJ [Winogradskyella sp.]